MAKDLQRHAVAYRMNGLPIFDKWPNHDEIIGYMSEPAWEWSEMADADRATVTAEADRNYERCDDRDLAMWAALGDNGINCFHRWIVHDEHRECAMCRTWEQLSGRVVMVGDKRMRVTDPPPPTIRVPAPVTAIAYKADLDLNSSIDVLEYRWDGSRYELAV